MSRNWVDGGGWMARFRSKPRGKFFMSFLFAIRVTTCDKKKSVLHGNYSRDPASRTRTHNSQSVTMVKKRNRDPEILTEAPQVDDEGSGSDTVSAIFLVSPPRILISE